MWQDKVIALCQIGAIVALLFIIFSKKKPSLTSSVMNTVFPAIISFCLFTLELYFACTTAAIISISWGIITVQILLNKDKKKQVN
jgi:hypothetical protein